MYEELGRAATQPTGSRTTVFQGNQAWCIIRDTDGEPLRITFGAFARPQQTTATDYSEQAGHDVAGLTRAAMMSDVFRRDSAHDSLDHTDPSPSDLKVPSTMQESQFDHAFRCSSLLPASHRSHEYLNHDTGIYPNSHLVAPLTHAPNNVGAVTPHKSGSPVASGSSSPHPRTPPVSSRRRGPGAHKHTSVEPATGKLGSPTTPARDRRKPGASKFRLRFLEANQVTRGKKKLVQYPAPHMLHRWRLPQ
ncbi:hypothetical protein C8T65DRAFT_643816 [Cerioporus squamosus]|nr:hypothetical protein C8T65DRAFT_643816 [Cerioporus squamosus]